MGSQQASTAENLRREVFGRERAVAELNIHMGTSRWRPHLRVFYTLALTTHVASALIYGVHHHHFCPSVQQHRWGGFTMRGGFTKKPAAAKRKRKKRTDAAPTPAVTPEAHMAIIQASVEEHAPQLLDDLARDGFAIVDNFLPATTVRLMRRECEGLLSSGEMVVSESTRWDEVTQAVETYQKTNVLSTNLKGGDDYHKSPRLVEYCVSLVSTLPPLVNARFGEGPVGGSDGSDVAVQLPPPGLSAKIHTNKLAVCLGEGSKYDKHYDNSGDLRKLTVLVYLQEAWDEANGGEFRMFLQPGAPLPLRLDRTGVTAGTACDLEPISPTDAAAADTTEATIHPCVDVAPLGGRLLAFWSDTQIHGVLPSHNAEASADAHRWALTVWLHAEDPEAIVFDAEAEERHFGRESTLHRALAG